MKTTTLNRLYDHNLACIGCGEDAHQGCGTVADCPFEDGELTTAVVLRAAAQMLRRFPVGRGADLDAALRHGAAWMAFDPAVHGGAGAELNVDDAVAEARAAITAYAAATGNTLLDAGNVDLYARTLLRSLTAEQLYAAAAHSAQIDFDPEEDEFDSYDED
jgi:hypothetical protein